VNEQWRDDEKAAHESKAEALTLACEHLEGVLPILRTPVDGLVEQAIRALRHERDRHWQAAKLAAAS
jgi:hypothetical protein